jgi:hypothetical protein
VSHRLAAGEEVLAVPEDLLQRLVFCLLDLGKQMVVFDTAENLCGFLDG